MLVILFVVGGLVDRNRGGVEFDRSVRRCLVGGCAVRWEYEDPMELADEDVSDFESESEVLFTVDMSSCVS